MLTHSTLLRRYQLYLDQIEQEVDEGRRAEDERVQSFEEFENEYEGESRWQI